MLLNFKNFNFWVILAGDAVLVTLAYFGSYLIRFEGGALPFQMHAFQSTVFWIVPVYIVTFKIFKLYKGMWRYAGIVDSINLFKAVVSATVAIMITVLLLHRFEGFSRSVFVINGVLIFLLSGGFRFCIRFVLQQNIQPSIPSLYRKGKGKNLLVVGAGSAGEKLIRELRENRELDYNLVGLIDDNPSKHKQTLHGVAVLGPLEKLPQLVNIHNVDEIAIAVPSASRRQMRRIIDTCKKTTAVYKTLPGIGDIIQGKVTFSELRPVRYEDLLKRPPITLDNDLICRYLTNRRVLVTGGAGSIGSELCRQIAAFSPKQIVILERNESGLYDLVADLRTAFPELDVVAALAAVQNRERMTRIFTLYKPEVVFHAAAYKHVPMMEDHPWEAIFNNVEGSRVVLQHCRRFGVQRCVMVSTDKAVRPTNVMGATKRLVELLTQSYAASNRTRYMAVRFGNVLGSVGSVLPLFQKQIAAGGPVTVTDPKMTRFFMTIPEACSLILQCGAFGKGGEIFVLKMGTPVCIDDMARDLISLSGYQPEEDIEIRYTGLRPGEKLYEELITEGENIRKTSHGDIMALASNCSTSREKFEMAVDNLIAAAGKGDAEKIKFELHEIIPEYHPWQNNGKAAVEEKTKRSAASALKTGAAKIHSPSYPSDLKKVAVEDHLLLQLLSTTYEKEQFLPIEALSILEWEKIIQSALKHNVASLLHLQLKRSKAADRLPLKIKKRLRKIYLYFVQAALRQQYWLQEILIFLEKKEVPVFLIDGPHVGEKIFSNIAARPLSEITLFLLEDDLRRMTGIHRKVDEINRQSGFIIHISFQIDYPELKNKIDMNAIRRRAHTANVADCRAKIASPEDLLIHICLNFVFYYKFKYAGLQTLCDLREILLKYSTELDWDKVHAISRNLSVTKSIGLTLRLAKDLLNASIATETINIFGSEDQFSLVRNIVLSQIFGKSYPMSNLSLPLSQLWQSQSIFRRTSMLAKFLLLSKFFPAEKVMEKETVMEQIYQEQQNTLIWEWIYGKRELSN